MPTRVIQPARLVFSGLARHPMKDTLRLQLDRLGLRLAELDASLTDNAVAADIKRFRALSKEQADVAEVVGLYRRYLQREEDLEVGDALFARAIEHFGLGEEDVEKLYTAIRA